MARVSVRKGMPSAQLTKAEFTERMRNRFYDPAFAKLRPQIETIVEAAWEAYDEYRKSPRTHRAGPGFADPSFQLPIEWLETRRAIRSAERRQKHVSSPSRILVVNASSRSEHTCPGEMSKTFRLASIAERIVRRAGVRGRPARPEPAHLRVRAGDLSLQGLRLHGDAAL